MKAKQTESVSDKPAATEIVVAPAPKPPTIPTPEHEVTARNPIRLSFHVGREFFRSFQIPNPDKRKRPTEVLHLYPTLADYVGRSIPDNVNPRSHDVGCLKGAVAKQIERTLTDAPENFFLANRGSTIIAESYSFNQKTGDVELVIADPENQGLADGATTDAVLSKVQTEIARGLLNKPDAVYSELALDGTKPESLLGGRIHLEVFIELDDRQRLAALVQGRNTSRQVRGWSMADFRGEFDWIKAVLEKSGSSFASRIGYEENADEEINILDVLAILTLFHPRFDQKDDSGTEQAPVIAYANRGRLDSQLRTPDIRKGYQELAPLLLDILRLHDWVYVGFEAAYDSVFGKKARLSRRKGVEARVTKMPLTGAESNYLLPTGFVFPLLASLRALVYRPRGGGFIRWRVDPFQFFTKHGPDLVAQLIEHYEAAGSNPNEVGKRKLVYTALHAAAKIALNEDREEGVK